MSAAPWIAVVPARAGSQGIAGKNRRTVGGEMLAARAMDRAYLLTQDPARVIVTTDDPVIADLARHRGHRIVERPADLAGPEATIASTVDHAVLTALPDEHAAAPAVAVCQPTSPTLEDLTVVTAAAEFSVRHEWDSLATVVADPHLMWRERSDGRVEPLYEARVNRQYRTDTVYRETGGLMLVRRWTGPEALISDAHHLWEISSGEDIDIDDPLDLVKARARARRAVIEWRVVAGQTVGYGHLMRCLTLAHEAPHHIHRFVVDGPPEARAMLEEQYPTIGHGEQYETAPDVVVFDCLNVSVLDYERARTEQSKVVGIELVGNPDGARYDLYVDELGARVPAPAIGLAAAFRLGPAYATLRDEFIAARTALTMGTVDATTRPDRVLVTFGGEDPARMTEMTMEAVATTTDARAVIGPGFDPAYAARLRDRWPGRIIEAASVRMAEEMLEAAVVVTSTGRTVWEAASLGCSILTIPVNERERDHEFPSFARRLPHYSADVPTIRLLAHAGIADDNSGDARRERARSAGIDGAGPRRVIWLIDGLLDDMVL